MSSSGISAPRGLSSWACLGSATEARAGVTRTARWCIGRGLRPLREGPVAGQALTQLYGAVRL